MHACTMDGGLKGKGPCLPMSSRMNFSSASGIVDLSWDLPCSNAFSSRDPDPPSHKVDGSTDRPQGAGRGKWSWTGQLDYPLAVTTENRLVGVTAVKGAEWKTRTYESRRA